MKGTRIRTVLGFLFIIAISGVGIFSISAAFRRSRAVRDPVERLTRMDPFYLCGLAVAAILALYVLFRRPPGRRGDRGDP